MNLIKAPRFVNGSFSQNSTNHFNVFTETNIYMNDPTAKMNEFK